jgi:hypothetical protein
LDSFPVWHDLLDNLGILRCPFDLSASWERVIEVPWTWLVWSCLKVPSRKENRKNWLEENWSLHLDLYPLRIESCVNRGEWSPTVRHVSMGCCWLISIDHKPVLWALELIWLSNLKIS